MNFKHALLKEKFENDIINNVCSILKKNHFSVKKVFGCLFNLCDLSGKITFLNEAIRLGGIVGSIAGLMNGISGIQEAGCDLMEMSTLPSTTKGFKKDTILLVGAELYDVNLNNQKIKKINELYYRDVCKLCSKSVAPNEEALRKIRVLIARPHGNRYFLTASCSNTEFKKQFERSLRKYNTQVMYIDISESKKIQFNNAQVYIGFTHGGLRCQTSILSKSIQPLFSPLSMNQNVEKFNNIAELLAEIKSTKKSKRLPLAYQNLALLKFKKLQHQQGHHVYLS